MVEARLLMREGERERADLMRLSLEWRLSQREAAPLLGVSVCQFKRLVHRPRAEGDAGGVSRRRGRPPNNRLSASLRARRARFGELLQIDGSPHDWFERRGPRCTLIVFIDDATNRLTSLRFAPAETTAACAAFARRDDRFDFS